MIFAAISRVFIGAVTFGSTVFGMPKGRIIRRTQSLSRPGTTE